MNYEPRRNGLTFWQTLFVFVVSGTAIVGCVETGHISRDYFQSIERAFDDYNASKREEWRRQNYDYVPPSPRFERACGKPIMIAPDPMPLIEYSHDFLQDAAKEAESIKDKAPHIMQMIGDYRVLRRAERVNQ